jgi:hypothetical protein
MNPIENPINVCMGMHGVISTNRDKVVEKVLSVYGAAFLLAEPGLAVRRA